MPDRLLVVTPVRNEVVRITGTIGNMPVQRIGGWYEWRLLNPKTMLILAQAGIHNLLICLDSGFRRSDEICIFRGALK